MTILTILYLLFVVTSSVFIFKIKNYVISVILLNLVWIILLILYWLRDDPLGNNVNLIEFIYPVIFISIVLSVIRAVKERRKTKINELEKMEIKDL